MVGTLWGTGNLLLGSGALLNSLTSGSSNNDGLSLLVSALGVVVGFILGVASYLIANPPPDIAFSSFSAKHDTGLIMSDIKKSIDLKKVMIARLPLIYGLTFFGLVITLLGMSVSVWFVIVYVLLLVIIFAYVSIKIHKIIQTNIDISEKLHERALKEFKAKIESDGKANPSDKKTSIEEFFSNCPNFGHR